MHKQFPCTLHHNPISIDNSDDKNYEVHCSSGQNQYRQRISSIKGKFFSLGKTKREDVRFTNGERKAIRWL